MSVIVNCSVCGDLDLPVSLFTVLDCAGIAALRYCFRCPGCGRIGGDSCSAQIAGRLLDADAQLRHIARPAELDDPARYKLSRIRTDDVLEFHEQLWHGDWFRRLQDTGRSAPQ